MGEDLTNFLCVMGIIMAVVVVFCLGRLSVETSNTNDSLNGRVLMPIKATSNDSIYINELTYVLTEFQKQHSKPTVSKDEYVITINKPINDVTRNIIASIFLNNGWNNVQSMLYKNKTQIIIY